MKNNEKKRTPAPVLIFECTHCGEENEVPLGGAVDQDDDDLDWDGEDEEEEEDDPEGEEE